MKRELLRWTAILCQLLSMFPFVILTEGAGLGKYVWWHYIAFFGMLAVFYGAGYLCARWVSNAGIPKRAKPFALFASRAAVVIPAAAFIVVCAIGKFSGMLYMYALPAGIIAYFGGYRTCGLEYCDVFSGGWFGLYFVVSVLTCFLIRFSYEMELYSAGVLQLCIVFGSLIVLASMLANQTNIDLRTRQRSGGKAVLPVGLRGYNAALIAAVSAGTVLLFLLAKPLASLAVNGIKALMRLLLSLLHNDRTGADEYIPDGGSGGAMSIDTADNSLFTALSFLLPVALIIIVICFRKRIWEFFKELFAPLFKENSRVDVQPFVDEITDTVTKSDYARSRRRLEQQLLRKFRRETDGTAKFRLGYRLFLVRLSHSAVPQIPSDTTTIHSQKGFQAFQIHEIDKMVSVYNEVRYGGRAPTEAELEMQEQLIEQLR